MMKFDHVVMNPPYDGNLHLKVVQEAMKHSDDVVNLSPIRWLQDPLAEYKKNSDWNKFPGVRAHIFELENIGNCDKDFGIQWGDLGVYHLTKEGGLKLKCGNSIFNKIIPFIEKDCIKNHVIEIKDTSKPFIQILDIYGGNPITGSGFIKPIDYEKREASTSSGNSKTFGIVFNSNEEANTFYKVSRSKLYLYFAQNLRAGTHYYFGKFIPYLGDYTHPWDDAALYKYFGLTQEEISLIEEEMKEAAKK